MNRGIEFTITTVATIVLMLLVAFVLVVVFSSNFSKASEPMEEITTDPDSLPAGIDTSIVLAKFHICSDDAKFKCFQPAPFDNEICGSGSEFSSMQDCTTPCASASLQAGVNKYPETGKCYCRCIK